MTTQQVVTPLGFSRRWVGAILGRGLLVGVVHPTLAMLVGVALGEQETHFWFGFSGGHRGDAGTARTGRRTGSDSRHHPGSGVVLARARLLGGGDHVARDPPAPSLMPRSRRRP